MAKRVHVRIASADDFRACGRPINVEQDQVRVTFNAGTTKAKAAVEMLIQAMGTNVSEFLWRCKSSGFVVIQRS